MACDPTKFPFTATKHKSPLGSYCSHAFQCNLRTEEAHNDENIGLQTFDVLGYLCTPLIGVYGEEYQPTDPLVVLRLPGSVVNELPWWKNKIERAVKSELIPDEFVVIVHAHPEFSVCNHFLCDDTDEVNIMPHPWLYGTREGFEFGTSDIQEHIFMGVFEPRGVKEAHQSLPSAEVARMNSENQVPENFDYQLLAGAPFSRLAPRITVVHWQAFSPNNGQLKLQSKEEWNEDCFTFYSVVLQPPTYHSPVRTVLTFHTIIESEKIEDSLVKSLEGVNDVGALLKAIGGVSDSLQKLVSEPITDLLTKVQAVMH